VTHKSDRLIESGEQAPPIKAFSLPLAALLTYEESEQKKRQKEAIYACLKKTRVPIFSFIAIIHNMATQANTRRELKNG
jgi:hypothetical protein